MTWDEKMLELLSEAYSGPCGDTGWGWKYPKGRPMQYHQYSVLWRYWLHADGSIMRWVPGKDAWDEVRSPRMRRALEIAAWPNWEPISFAAAAEG